MRPAAAVYAFIVALLIALPMATPAQGDAVSIQLNKLEPDGDACRAYLVLENPTGSAFASLQLDLVMFDTNGIIAKRLAVEAGALPADKTRVKVFGISEVACGEIGRVLLNGILACEHGGREREDCLNLVRTDSASDVTFIQ